MGKCFVIQPFDGGKFDKRYEDVFAPAIKDAQLEPYRVDQDPSTTIPIDTIATQISTSTACLCDITRDNPNVWFELGYAIASQKDVVLICAEERTTFPFDVQHRAIIKYSTDSTSDFARLRENITNRLIAVLEKRTALQTVGAIASVSKVEGLEQFELAALVAVAQVVTDPEDGASAYTIRQDMELAGFTKVATTLGLRSLLDKGLLTTITMREHDGSAFNAYTPTTMGMRWLFDNKDKLTLRIGETASPAPAETGVSDDDIPF